VQPPADLRPGLTLGEARKESRGVLGAVARGGDPLQTTTTFRAVVDDFFGRDGKPTVREATSKPYSGGSYSQRSAVARSVTSDVPTPRNCSTRSWTSAAPAWRTTLRLLSKVMGRYSSRMVVHREGNRTKWPAECAWSRILSDDEIRKIWAASGSRGEGSGEVGDEAAITTIALPQDERTNDRERYPEWLRLSGGWSGLSCSPRSAE
jgi:hypothetical protein